MSAGGALAHRFGAQQALSISAIIFGATLCAWPNAQSEAWVAIALIVAGFLGGVVDILMNAEGARIERLGSAARFQPGPAPRAFGGMASC